LIDVIYLKKPLLQKARAQLINKKSLVLLMGNVDWPNDDQGRGKGPFLEILY